MESAGKRLRTRTDIGKDIERCLDDLKITHAELAEMLNVSDKTVDRMIGGKGPTTKYSSALAKYVYKRQVPQTIGGNREIFNCFADYRNVARRK